MEELELYEGVMVYRNVFNEPEKMFRIIKDSCTNNPDRILGYWSQWSHFGEYIKEAWPNKSGFNKNNKPGKFDFEDINDLVADTKIQEEQKHFLLEMYRGFNEVTNSYILKYGEGFNFDKNETIKTKDGSTVPLWITDGPSFCKYHKDISEEMSMVYHSDYIREPIKSPGYKFAITSNYYFNDNYQGGEVDFYIDDKLIKYKPKAGDWLVFPSGHPEVLNKNDKVYLHGVFPSTEGEKFFCRNYWMKYEVGSQEWFDKEEEFGKEAWAAMQDDIMKPYRPSRFKIEGERIK